MLIASSMSTDQLFVPFLALDCQKTLLEIENPTCKLSVEESDSQFVSSLAVPPTRVPCDVDTSPIPRPSSVTTTPPVLAEFQRVLAPTCGVSADTAPVMLEVRWPVVRSRRKLLFSIWDTMPAVEVSENQLVEESAVLLTRATELTAKMPKNEPWRLILTDEVQGRFILVRVLNELESADNASVSEDVCSPFVSKTVNDAVINEPPLHMTEVTLVQTVNSQLVDPDLDRYVERAEMNR
ncbi:hypothetical protein GUITHDRAFT_98933 [Guillardia theta CCMP2712]|uniref:Uncharacterized protein n=1 Tax=Guillardia theta (strain CCMP2712) TaxID=905079 RepID=L1K2U7_GUITC|nr:hypothetical protein GUITHDRAFT_98933 [Guillardia theta CCMP2712]EKX55151.1 hypothetical protein GUITHDRAFT_98933 [Guillardia theta CCMP2712]|eukprot:XP_005842131.1 hypothetical protein GUITHDRAFT_98933 [Guillardia theta CCMP2712]